MSIVDTILRRRRTSKIEKLQNASQQYQQLLIDAATDESAVDSDHVEQLLADMGLTVEQFAKDVQVTKERRIPARQQLEREPQIRADFAAAQAEFERLNAEVTEYRNRMSIKIQAAHEKLRRLELEVAQCDNARQTLRETVIDKSLLEREKLIGEQLREIAERREHVEGCIDTTKQHLEANQKSLDWYEENIDPRSRATDATRKDHQAKLAQCQSGRARLQQQLSDQQARLAEVHAEYKAAQAELAQIQQQKLNP